MNDMMTDLGKVIDAADYQKYIDEANLLPRVEKIYGEPYNIPDYPCWMDYGSLSTGSISFTRHTYNHPVLKEMSDKVVELLLKLLPGTKIYPDRVHILRTVRGVPPHRDEGGRMTCINIGVRNSTTAITKFGVDDVEATFRENHADFIVQDGHAYLVNVARLHAVVGTDAERFLITYGSPEKYGDILSRIKIED